MRHLQEYSRHHLFIHLLQGHDLPAKERSNPQQNISHYFNNSKTTNREMLTTCLPKYGPVVNRIFLTVSVIPKQQPCSECSELQQNYEIATILVQHQHKLKD